MAIERDQLQNLTIEELSELLTVAKEVLDAKRKAELTSAKAEMSAIAKRFGTTVAEMFGFGGGAVIEGKALKGGRKVSGEAKYRHPENPALTWTGRGRQPGWVADHIAQGGSKEDLLIG